MKRRTALLVIGLLAIIHSGCYKDCSYRVKLMRNKVVLLSACVEDYKATHGVLPSSLSQVEKAARNYLRQNPEVAKTCLDESWTEGQSTFTSVTPREQILYLAVDPEHYYLFDYWTGFLNRRPDEAELLSKAKANEPPPTRRYLVKNGLFVSCRIGPKPPKTQITLSNAASFMMPFTFNGHIWCD